MKHEGWPDVLDASAVDRLERYEDLLRSRAIPRGMISGADLAGLRERHVLDALRGAPHIAHDVRRACDLGSGAGIPGIPLAIVRPDVRFVLSEPRRARAAFLELVADALGLANVVVFPGPAGDLSERFEACFARGFGGPAASWAAAVSLLEPSGVLLYWAGASFRPSQIPSGAVLHGLVEPTLESGGPIVIMARQ